VGVTAEALAGALAAITRGRVRSDGPALDAAAIDGRVPRWLVTPASVDELAQVIALAHAERLAVVPRGSGSALGLGRPPRRLDVVVDLGGLDRVIEYNPDDLTITVQVGVRAGALAARLGERRQLLAMDPPGWSTRTLGGITATNASGPLRTRYGTVRDLLLGVRFVQADGVMTWGGARVVKSVTGYDIPKLMTGALGTLGVLAELTLRLHPMPEFEATALLTFRGVGAAQEFVAALLDSTIQPGRLEYLDARALDACRLPPAAAALALSIATVEPAVRAQQAAVAALAARAHGEVSSMGATFWRTYDAARANGDDLVLRVGTLTSRLAGTLDEIHAVFGDAAAVSGSPAIGALRIAAPMPDLAGAADGITRLRALVGEVEGSVILERAPLALRERVDPWGPVAPGNLALMRALKAEFDPDGVLNPGRFAGDL
jgi:glycolate dehydrogenase FAD-binding subunit